MRLHHESKPVPVALPVIYITPMPSRREPASEAFCAA